MIAGLALWLVAGIVIGWIARSTLIVVHRHRRRRRADRWQEEAWRLYDAMGPRL